MISAETYQILTDDKDCIDQIITKFSDGKHRLHPEIQTIHELGTELIQTIQSNLADSRFTLQKIARPMHQLMSSSPLFHGTDHLASPDDLPRLLDLQNSDDATANLGQRIHQYFQAYEAIEYNPRSYYFYYNGDDYLIHFQEIDMGSLLASYHDIVDVIQNRDTRDIVDDMPVHPEPEHERLDSDVYVLRLIIEHQKAHLYHLSEDEMRAVLGVGKRLQILARSDDPDRLRSLDGIAQGMIDLRDQGICDPRTIADIVPTDTVTHAASSDSKYVRSYGRTTSLNFRLMVRKYQMIVNDVFQVSRM